MMSGAVLLLILLWCLESQMDIDGTLARREVVKVIKNLKEKFDFTYYIKGMKELFVTREGYKKRKSS